MAGSIAMTIRKQAADGLDPYFTQPWATRVLLERAPVSGVVWEPACGGGHMARVMTDRGLDVFASDVSDYGYDRQDAVVDFVEGPVPAGARRADWVVTNPPFKRNMSEKFVRRGLELGCRVAVLCRLTWLEGGGRCDRLFGPRPPDRVIVLVDRLGFSREEVVVGQGGMIPYAWYCWEGRGGERRVEWAPRGTASRLTHPDDVERFSGRTARG